MKRLLLTLCLSLLVMTPLMAQDEDMAKATELYNNGVNTLNEGNKAEALKFFEEALELAEIIGGEALSLADNCKEAIPQLYLEIGKDYIKAKDIDNAVSYLNLAIKKAENFNNEDVINQATNLIPQLYMAEGNAEYNSGNFAGAVAHYKKVTELTPENGMAYLRLGTASSKTDDDATTIAAFEMAAQKGQANQANSQLSSFYLKKADAFRKAKQNAECMKYAEKSYTVKENATAYKIYGMAAINLKKFNEAITGFESYLSLSPNAKDTNPIMFQTAKAYEAVGQKDKACGYYRQIMSDPQFQEYATHKVNTELKCN